MRLGGVPYYLNFLSPQKSIFQNIEDECFDLSGRLVEEYSVIFNSLFTNADDHKKVIDFVASKHKGMILEKLNRKVPALKGGSLTRILDNFSL